MEKKVLYIGVKSKQNCPFPCDIFESVKELKTSLRTYNKTNRFFIVCDNEKIKREFEIEMKNSLKDFITKDKLEGIVVFSKKEQNGQ